MVERSAATIEVYAAKAQAQLQRAATQLNLGDWAENPSLVCAYIGERRHRFTKATWRVYRASIACYLELQGFQQEADYVRALSQEPCLKKSNKTSAKKLKQLPSVKLDKLVGALDNERGKYDRLIKYWLLSGALTGLRPCEWQDVTSTKSVLVIRNAKSSNARSFGEHRQLDYSELSEGDVHIIDTFIRELMEACGESGMSVPEIYTACRKRLLQVNKALGV